MATGDFFLAYWAQRNLPLCLVIGFILNFIGLLFYAFSMRFEQVGIATAIMLGLNIFVVAVGGWIVFNETLSWSTMGGLLLLIIAIILIEL